MKDFGKYKIKKQIGIGGTASVYLAEHTGLNRDVVLKVMSDGLFSQDIDYKKLFVEEAQIIAKLNHPNILQVYDISSSNKRTYIEMEYLSGRTLKERINKKLYFDPIRVIREIASALQYVFDTTGTIHRDIKPSNILFREDDKELVAVLSDFGIAKTEDNETEFTSIGVRVGTPRYMSPEQLMGGEVDHRSDLYSLGIILYELVSGELYNRDKSPDVVENFKTPKLPNEHKKLQPIINMLTASNPNDRFKTAEELIISLRRFDGYLSTSSENSEINKLEESTFTRLSSSLKKPERKFIKSAYLIYTLIFFVNIAGGAYLFLDGTDKKDRRTSDIENLEVMLLSFDQNETDSQNINEMISKLKNKYPNEKNIKIFDQKVLRISQRNRKRFLLNSTNGLMKNKEYELAENQLSMVMKLSPTEIETEETNLILKLIAKKKKEELKLRELKFDKLKLESELKIATKQSESKIILEQLEPKIAIEQSKSKAVPVLISELNITTEQTKKTNSQEQGAVLKKSSVKTTSTSNKTDDDCHYHLNAKLDRHCHKSPSKNHSHERKAVKKTVPKKNPWIHYHAKKARCTSSVKHSHKYSKRDHEHKYRCTEEIKKEIPKPKPKPKPDPFRHVHPAKPKCTTSLAHSHKFKKLQHEHKYQCEKEKTTETETETETGN